MQLETNPAFCISILSSSGEKQMEDCIPYSSNSVDFMVFTPLHPSVALNVSKALTFFQMTSLLKEIIIGQRPLKLSSFHSAWETLQIPGWGFVFICKLFISVSDIPFEIPYLLHPMPTQYL